MRLERLSQSCNAAFVHTVEGRHIDRATQCKLYANTKVIMVFNSIQISMFLLFIAFILSLDMSLHKYNIENCYQGFKADGT